MDNSSSAKDAARKAAERRTQPKNKGTPLSQKQGRTDGQGNNLTSFGEDASGFKLSPQTVMLICLVYIGSVVALHIFGKIKSASTQSQTPPPNSDM
jgi:hypothetical protein